MIDFTSRSGETEIMDDLKISGEVVPQTLHELEIINKFLGGNHVTISGIVKLLEKHELNGNTLKIADMGCGGGDMLMMLANWANKKKVNVQLTGIDANPNIIEYARSHSKDFENIEYRIENVFDLKAFKSEYDIIISTLFLHHFDNEQCAALLKDWYSRSKLGVVVNDLHRHPVAYHSIKFLTKVFSRSFMVKNDGPLSVLRAFTKEELTDIVLLAEIDNYVLDWQWAFRWRLVLDRLQH